jgi:hypothetical protein
LLEHWVGLVLQVANTSPAEQEAPDVHVRVQEALTNVILGGPGSAPMPGPIVRYLPHIGFRLSRGGRLEPIAEAPPFAEAQLPGRYAFRFVIEGHGEQLRNVENQLLAVVMALSTDAHAQLLRRCNWLECSRFFFSKADHRRPRSFCGDEHRRLYERAHRDPAQVASYMRKYRANPARRKTLQGRKGK